MSLYSVVLKNIVNDLSKITNQKLKDIDETYEKQVLWLKENLEDCKTMLFPNYTTPATPISETIKTKNSLISPKSTNIVKSPKLSTISITKTPNSSDNPTNITTYKSPIDINSPLKEKTPNSSDNPTNITTYKSPIDINSPLKEKTPNSSDNPTNITTYKSPNSPLFKDITNSSDTTIITTNKSPIAITSPKFVRSPKLSTISTKISIQNFQNLQNQNQDKVKKVFESYELSDLENTSDEERTPRKPVPIWASSPMVMNSLSGQRDPDFIFPPMVTKTCNLEDIFRGYRKRQRYNERTSSGNWMSPRYKSPRLISPYNKLMSPKYN